MQCGPKKQLQSWYLQSVGWSVGWLVGQSVSWLVSWLVGRLVFDWDLIRMQRGENGYEATLDTGRG